MKKRLYTYAVLTLTTTVAALCATAAEYDVTRYGAKPDGKSDNTAAIQKAIDDCAVKGGGRVLVPGGGTKSAGDRPRETSVLQAFRRRRNFVIACQSHDGL